MNVWFGGSSFEQTTSNISERFNSRTNYNIDCYAYAPAYETAEGHMSGDEAAARAVQAVARKTRQALMSSANTYLGLRGTVWQRWIESITQFQPEFDGQPIHPVIAIRISLSVSFNEFSPQYAEENLEALGISIQRAEDGSVLAQTEYTWA